MKSASPAFHQPLKYKERSVLHSKRSTDDRSDQSSVKSTDSNSFPSPCASPSPPSSGKVQYLLICSFYYRCDRCTQNFLYSCVRTPSYAPLKLMNREDYVLSLSLLELVYFFIVKILCINVCIL